MHGWRRKQLSDTGLRIGYGHAGIGKLGLHGDAQVAVVGIERDDGIGHWTPRVSL